MNSIFLRNEEFKLFSELIYELCGISLNSSKKILVENRLASRLRYYTFKSYLEYYRFITDTANFEEKQLFIDIITTNETSFFREPIHFNYLEKEILPKIDKTTTFKVWSAACSTGEEAYSIAMILESNLKTDLFEIHATDISQRVLEKAQTALYTIDKINKIPAAYLKKYCLKGVGEKLGFFRINKFLRSKIEFKQLNLNQVFPKMPTFDVVFLRNVMIYFDLKTRNQLIERILPFIKKGGYLFIGHSETLVNVETSLKMIMPTIYRRYE